ncbi:MAG: cytochrome c [Pseudomonadota bacterium]|nr:cytochrome c [Pseudomonadota bacterium]
MRLLLAILLAAQVGCGGGTPAATTAPPKAQAATGATAAAPAPAAAVGPDGPLTITVPALAGIPDDAASVADGEKAFAARGCGACHAFGSKLVGPDLVGITTRRSLPWIERMILAPDVMIKEDPVAKDLYRSHMTPMPKQGVTNEELPKLLAFVKSKGG